MSRRKKMGMVRLWFLRLHQLLWSVKAFEEDGNGQSRVLEITQLLWSVEAFCLQLQGVLQLPGFERMGHTHFPSLHLLYFIGMDNCPAFLKTFHWQSLHLWSFWPRAAELWKQNIFHSGKRGFIYLQPMLGLPHLQTQDSLGRGQSILSQEQKTKGCFLLMYNKTHK